MRKFEHMKKVSKMMVCVFLQVKIIYHMELIGKYDERRSNFFSQIFHSQNWVFYWSELSSWNIGAPGASRTRGTRIRNSPKRRIETILIPLISGLISRKCLETEKKGDSIYFHLFYLFPCFAMQFITILSHPYSSQIKNKSGLRKVVYLMVRHLRVCGTDEGTGAYTLKQK